MTIYKQWRAKNNITDDTDFAQAQSVPAAADIITLKNEQGLARDQERAVLLFVEFLKADGTLANGATDRGSFDLEIVEVCERERSILGADSDAYTQSSKRTGLKGWQPIIVDGLDPGMKLATRFSAITIPTGGSATKLRVLYTEFTL